MLNTARTIITCHIDVEIVLGSVSLPVNGAAVVGLNKINEEAVQNFGHMLITSSHKTTFADGTFFNYTPRCQTARASDIRSKPFLEVAVFYCFYNVIEMMLDSLELT